MPSANGPALAKQSTLTGFSNFSKEEMPFRIDQKFLDEHDRSNKSRVSNKAKVRRKAFLGFSNPKLKSKMIMILSTLTE